MNEKATRANELTISKFPIDVCFGIITGMEWYTGYDESHDLLAVLRSPDILELWDGYSGVRLWRKVFGEPIQSMAFNPFDISSLVCRSKFFTVVCSNQIGFAALQRINRLAFKLYRGWSGGTMVLGKLPMPGRPTVWMIVGQGPIALAVGVVGGCLDIFTLLYLFSPVCPSLWETARYRLKYCLKGPLNPKPTSCTFMHGFQNNMAQ